MSSPNAEKGQKTIYFTKEGIPVKRLSVKKIHSNVASCHSSVWGHCAWSA